MCIKVTRWFYCYVPAVGQPPQDHTTHRDADRFKPWIHWKVNELVALAELRTRAPSCKGYSRIRHKMEHWIRCARVQTPQCKEGPTEHRVELYNIACPECTQDHPSVMSTTPYYVHIDEWPGVDADGQIERIVAYFGELLVVARSFFENELDREPLQGRNWNVFARGHNCTQDSSHILRDHPDRVGHPECLVDCACSANPGAHNISRAARNQEGQLTRIRHARNWFLLCLQDTFLEEWKTARFADMPNQFELNMDPAMQERHDYMMLQIGEQLTALTTLDFNPDNATELNPRIEDLNEWRLNLRRREHLCTLLVRFAAADPGINMKFADGLMRLIVTALAPGLDRTLVPQHIFSKAATIKHMKLLVAYVDRLHTEGSYPKQAEMTFALRRQKELFEVLGRNRLVTFRNIMARQKTAEGVAARWEVIGASILQTGYEEDQNCSICGDDFDTSAANADSVPRHLRPVRLPCCQQFIHFRCFKGLTTTTKQACPFCNQDLTVTGMDHQNEGAFWNWNTPLENLPHGLVRYANNLETNRAMMQDAAGTHIVRALNPVIEREENLRPGRIGNSFRNWPLPPSSDESGDESSGGSSSSGGEDDDIAMEG